MADQVIFPQVCAEKTLYTNPFSGKKYKAGLCVSAILRNKNTIYLVIKITNPDDTPEFKIKVASASACQKYPDFEIGGVSAYVETCVTDVSLDLPDSASFTFEIKACVNILGEHCKTLFKETISIGNALSEFTLAHPSAEFQEGDLLVFAEGDLLESIPEQK